MVTVQPAPNTIAAASGSAAILNSAAGVTFPRPAEPPMITKFLTWETSSGYRRSASATLVSGPIAIKVICPGSAAVALARKSTACPSAGPDDASGMLAAPSPESPCTARACIAGRCSGPGQPATTGTSRMPTKSRTRSAFAVVLSSPTFPATVVIPRRSSSGWPAANASARASSIPGSQSMMIFCTVTLRSRPAGGRLPPR